MKKTLLFDIGLNIKEAQVYQAALKFQKISPAALAKQTKLPRPTIYNICKNLVAKGLLVEDLGDKTLQLIPASPADLQTLVLKEEQEYKSRAKLIEELANELALLQSQENYPVPKIRFIEEKNIEDYLYTKSSAWNESIISGDETWWGFQDHSFVEKYQKWIDWFWKRAPSLLHVKLLSNQSKIEDFLKGKYERREIKIWNKSENFTATTWVLGDYIVMIVTNKQPHYLVEIYDATMAHNLRETFKNLWSLI